MKLLHANFLTQSDVGPSSTVLDVTEFIARFLETATTVPDDVLMFWLNDSWRECLTAAWIIALRPDERFRPELTRLLLTSETSFQGQGICIATARYRDEQAANNLIEYLNLYLPVGDRQYDQAWAVGSLAWLDLQHGKNHSETFLSSTDDWSVVAAEQVVGALSPDWGIQIVADVMAFLDRLASDLPDQLEY